VAYQRLEDERAQRLTALAISLMSDPVDPTIELCGLTLQAMIAFDTAEDPHKVVATLRDHWQRLADKAVSPILVAYAALVQRRMALRVGENVWAAEVLERVDKLGTACGEQALARAILQVHKGKNGNAPAVTASRPHRTRARDRAVDAGRGMVARGTSG
jgi:LuxR family transcriptional regulator, maltose regulon positive regulatory protein